jgi:hypothetical protein
MAKLTDAVKNAVAKVLPKAAGKPTLPDLRNVKPLTKAQGLTVLAYDAEKEKIVLVTVQAIIGPQPNPNPDPNLADDLPLASSGGIAIGTGDGTVLVGDIRK